jgi:hypothetical protein
MRGMTSGRKLWMSTSQRSTRRSATSWPAGLRRSSEMLRLLRLRARNEALTPLTEMMPALRAGSPVPMGSILITSAPMSASICVQKGPKMKRDRSSTRMP